MSTHNIGFNEDMTKIIFELSSNTDLISSALKLELMRLLMSRLIYTFVISMWTAAICFLSARLMLNLTVP